MWWAFTLVEDKANNLLCKVGVIYLTQKTSVSSGILASELSSELSQVTYWMRLFSLSLYCQSLCSNVLSLYICAQYSYFNICVVPIQTKASFPLAYNIIQWMTRPLESLDNDVWDSESTVIGNCFPTTWAFYLMFLGARDHLFYSILSNRRVTCTGLLARSAALSATPAAPPNTSFPTPLSVLVAASETEATSLDFGAKNPKNPPLPLAFSLTSSTTLGTWESSAALGDISPSPAPALPANFRVRNDESLSGTQWWEAHSAVQFNIPIPESVGKWLLISDFFSVQFRESWSYNEASSTKLQKDAYRGKP